MVFWIPAQSVFRSLSINIKGIHSSRDLNLMWIIAVNHWPNASVRHVIVVSIHNSIVLSSILPHINVTQDSCLSLPSFYTKSDFILSFTWFVSHFLSPRFLLQMISKPQYSRTYFSNILAAITNFKRWKHFKNFQKNPVIWCIILFKIEDIKGI